MQIQTQELQKRLPLIIAVACGILAILLLNAYLKKKEEQIFARMKQAQQKQPVQPVAPPQQMRLVLVAQQDIPVQVPIAPGDITIKEVPIQYIQPGAANSIDQVIGQIASSPIAAGEQILQTKLLPPGNIGKTLSQITPQGKRAVTVTVDNISDISNLIQPGDHIDVFAFLTPPSTMASLAANSPKTTEVSSSTSLVPLFQNVEVLAVGDVFVPTNRLEVPKEPTRGLSTRNTASTVTLALNPQEAVLISFVQDNGRLRLILRSSEDVKKEAIKPADWDTLFQYLYPDKVIDAQGNVPTVEIYHGLRKEIIPLSEKGK